MQVNVDVLGRSEYFVVGGIFCQHFISKENSLLEKIKMQAKIVVVGDGAVGKTCLLSTYTTKAFPGDYIPTVLDHHSSLVDVDGSKLRLSLYDTIAHEDNDRIRPLSYPKTNIFLCCFSIASKSSYDNVRVRWLPELQRYNAGTPILLVGTKSDLRTDQATLARLAERRLTPITHELGLQQARKIGAIGYLECSALNRVGVTELFDEALRAIITPRPPLRDESCFLL